MATTSISQGAAIPLPPLPEREPFSPEQWTTLAAIFDTVIPSFISGKGNSLIQYPLEPKQYDQAKNRIAAVSSIESNNDLLDKYLAESATSQPEFRDSVMRLFADQIDPAAAAGLRLILNVLG